MGQSYKDELRTKKRRKLLFKFVLFGFVCLVGLIGLAYLLFFAGLLDVRTVAVTTSDGLRADINTAVDNWLDSGFWKLTRRADILFFSTDKLSAQLAKRFPKLGDTKITKRPPHSLLISGDERKPAGIWCLAVSGGCFYFDKTGVIFSPTRSSTGFLILNVNDRRYGELKLGDKVSNDIWLANIVKARDLLTKADINVSEFVIPADSFDEFHAKTAEGWKILFSNQTDIRSQISALGTFLKEKIKPSQRANLQYVDLRIQDRIYYK